MGLDARGLPPGVRRGLLTPGGRLRESAEVGYDTKVTYIHFDVGFALLSSLSARFLCR